MRLTVNGFDIQIEMLSKCAKHDIIRSLYPSLASPPRVENKPPPVPGRRQHLLQGLPTLDILPALKREDSNAGQRATLASPLATSRLPNGVGEAIAGSCAIRRPREGCGVFGVHLDAVSACTVHTIRLGETAGMPPVAGFPASGHGPCHRPACPSCGSRRRSRLVITKDTLRLSNAHGGQAQASEGRFLSAVSPRPRRRPLGNGMVAFVVRADPNPTAGFCPLCLTSNTLSAGLFPAVVTELSDSSPP